MKSESREFKVSVIIPTRNGLSRGFLSESISSVLNQSIPPEEVILIDDGSTDQTAEFVGTNYPSVRVQRQEARGLSAARNTGLKICSGDFVAFIDDDDIWLSHKLEKQLEFLRSSENEFKIGVGCDSYAIDALGRRLSKIECFVESIQWPHILAVHPIWHGGSSLLLRKSALEKVGLFDEQMHPAEDYDYWIRASKSFEFGWVRELLLERRKHKGQISLQRRLVVNKIIKVFNFHLQDLEETFRGRYSDFFFSFQAIYAIRCREFPLAIGLFKKVIFANPIVWIFHLLKPLRHHNIVGRLNQRMVIWYLSKPSS